MMDAIDLSDVRWRHYDNGQRVRCGGCGVEIPPALNRAHHPVLGTWCWNCLAESQMPTVGKARHVHVDAADLDEHLDRVAAVQERRQAARSSR